MADPGVTSQSSGDIGVAFVGYLKGLDEKRKLAVFSDLRRFIEIAEDMPDDCTGPDDFYERMGVPGLPGWGSSCP